jgi:hypothetical protein
VIAFSQLLSNTAIYLRSLPINFIKIIPTAKPAAWAKYATNPRAIAPIAKYPERECGYL